MENGQLARDLEALYERDIATIPSCKKENCSRQSQFSSEQSIRFATGCFATSEGSFFSFHAISTMIAHGHKESSTAAYSRHTLISKLRYHAIKSALKSSRPVGNVFHASLMKAS